MFKVSNTYYLLQIGLLWLTLITNLPPIMTDESGPGCSTAPGSAELVWVGVVAVHGVSVVSAVVLLLLIVSRRCLIHNISGWHYQDSVAFCCPCQNRITNKYWQSRWELFCCEKYFWAHIIFASSSPYIPYSPQTIQDSPHATFVTLTRTRTRTKEWNLWLLSIQTYLDKISCI